MLDFEAVLFALLFTGACLLFSYAMWSIFND